MKAIQHSVLNAVRDKDRDLSAIYKVLLDCGVTLSRRQCSTALCALRKKGLVRFNGFKWEMK